MQRKKLPIGVQTFAKIRGDDYDYVDKTPFIYQLVREGSYYFLSRPRRFGKSLLVDTLAELFAGNEPLFSDQRSGCKLTLCVSDRCVPIQQGEHFLRA